MFIYSREAIQVGCDHIISSKNSIQNWDWHKLRTQQAEADAGLFEASLEYKVIYGPARATWWNPVLRKIKSSLSKTQASTEILKDPAVPLHSVQSSSHFLVTSYLRLT